MSRDHKWKLGVQFKDKFSNSECFRARFDSDVLDKLTGVTGIEMNNLNKERHSRPQAIGEIQEILSKLSSKLESLDAFMKIEFSSDSALPIVMEIIEPAKVLNQILEQKLNFER